MAASPEYELQVAQFAVLSGAACQAMVAGGFGVHDRVPKGASFPYVTIGDGHNVGDLAQGYDGGEIHVDVHVWSRAVGKVEAKIIAHAVRLTCAPMLGGPAPFELVTNQLVTWGHVGSEYLDDPDGLTTHGIVHLKYLTAPQT